MAIEMAERQPRYAPGRVRDGILQVMSFTSKALSAKEIGERVSEVVGPTKESSVRSYLRLNTPRLFIREERGVYKLHSSPVLGIQRGLPLPEKSEAPVMFGGRDSFMRTASTGLANRKTTAFTPL